MQAIDDRINLAINDLKQGKMIILIDDPDRENEGDLIIPAEKITPEIMNFMIRQGTGIVCLSLAENQLAKLKLPLMLSSDENTSSRGTPFTISIDAKDGISTGVSAADRTQTIQVAINDDVQPEQLVKPGHIFPLRAKHHGVLERQGHTEGAIDIVRLAGFKPAAVLCEIMNPDGTMASGNQLTQFAQTHQLNTLAISDILTYRLARENMIAEEVSTTLPIEQYGDFAMTVIREKITEHEHMILTKQKINAIQPTLVRIHSSCVTGDLFASKRCNCHAELHYSLQRIQDEGGILIYLNQEGRGIGLLNKIKAYALQDTGLDTVEANEQLGLPIDARNYAIAANILRNLNIKQIRLITNNPNKVSDLKKYGIHEVIRESLPIFPNKHNYHYLKTKKEKLHHLIHFSAASNHHE
ncbi:MAG: bifunctional 3,4-dihydroxy-2-butanone 4-phosphate synthase/GTP cyclohydrolase II [Gammaproteobacteria bacterium RIFCSPHIGHO2_12_FULL_37_14]|nr:MAG: bifunctional 3,4-dihydroxy-2-butanone 4-phosphate synthase/GTP cyclohydrolase II [Gammaproteobacteria bacterium RIFCSPHIGHO2_12_FULL_37_14]